MSISSPRLRIVRRLKELPGLPAKPPDEIIRPAQHGQNRKKLSEYAVRLQEKQKLRFNYGVTERQLLRYVRKARRVTGATGQVLLQFLEIRAWTILCFGWEWLQRFRPLDNA